MESEREKFPLGINIFVIRDGKLLLGKRKNAYGDGDWGLPGGHLEKGEKMVGAAARELDEETGLSAQSFTFLNMVNDARDDQHYIQIGFLANDVDGEPELREPDRCYEWEWFGLGELPDNIFVGHAHQIESFKRKVNFFE
ncbi:MAG: NUDIX domain-containing protein [Candidatus Curtissbacteria bacterium]|nr:NUDIX domain-containing protein [Candidatus Curtissbacteria bacterium]